MNTAHTILSTLAVALGLGVSGDALAQHDHAQHQATTANHPTQVAAKEVQAAQPAGMDHDMPPHGGAMQATDEIPVAIDHTNMDHAGMDHGTQPASQAPREPIPALTDTDRAAAFPTLTSHQMEHGPAINSLVLFNRFEVWDADPGTGQAWEAQAWIGGDINRLWLRSEGERVRGSTRSSDLEVLYGHSISPWWDVVTGIKQDFRPADSQTWAALGVQGMAPYKFEVAATAYLGQSGQMAATVEVEYELLLTNRLILQPLLELRFNSKDDAQRQVGSGLGKVEAGLRLRYEFNRRFAPYLGIAHERTYGNTADFHQAAGEAVRDTRFVAGVRFWF